STGGLVLYEFRAITVEERVDKCYVYEHNYTNTNLSGTYNVNTSAHTENITRNNGTFSVNFGQTLISIDMFSAIIRNNTETYTANITAYNGDLRNLTLNLTISNKAVLNKTASENWTKNISEILSGESKTVNWTVNGTGVGETNTTVFVNATTGEGGYNSSTWEVEGISNDIEAPNITAFWFEYEGSKTNKTNLRTSFSVLANITDNYDVRSAKANITYPDNSSFNGTMSLFSGSRTNGTWRFTFEGNPENLVLNQTGNYTIRISARDIAYNETIGQESKNFTVNDTYTLNLTPNYSAYNRGEGVTIQVWDVNGNLVEDLNWTVNLTKYSQNETTVYNGTNISYAYLINASDPAGNYTLFANVSKSGNRGNDTWAFNVSDELNLTFIQPEPGTHSRGASLGLVFVKIYNVRGDVYTTDDGTNATLTCLNESYAQNAFNLAFAETLVPYTDVFYLLGGCYSPSSYATAFNIIVNATDYYNNTGSESLSLNTESGPPSTGGGGEGKAKAGDVIIEVAPPACGAAPKERELLLQSPETFELVRGSNGTFVIKVTNPCPNSTLENVTLSVEGYSPQHIKLLPKKAPRIEYNKTGNFEVFVAAPIYMEKGTHPLDFTVAANASYRNYPKAISKTSGNVTSYENISIGIIESGTVALIIHEISREDAIAFLTRAEKDQEEMQNAGLPANRTLKLLDNAKKALEQGDYEKTKELGEQIADLKQAAFTAYDLIEDLRVKIRHAEVERGLKVIETKDVFNLALAAFERGDYETAQQRIKDAQLVYSLETKGKINLTKIILDYWWAISLGIVSTSVAGFVAYQMITVKMIAKKLESLYLEETNIMELVNEAQKRYYREKSMSQKEFRDTMDKYEEGLADIQGTREKLRARRVGMVNISDELENLKRENENIAALIKKVKHSYFKDRSMSPSLYQKSMEQYRLIKAEIEGDMAMLEAKIERAKR
ncbi:hypothetical protein KKA03_05515, partial [archaeon]|nr:hypothetical protein [archaeon]